MFFLKNSLKSNRGLIFFTSAILSLIFYLYFANYESSKAADFKLKAERLSDDNNDDNKNKKNEKYEYEDIPYDVKQKADYIFEVLRCPTCQNIPLRESHSQIAENMKKIIIQKLQDGWTETQIINYFVQRYGDEILLQPKTKIFYILPVIFLALSFISLFILIRKSKANKNSI